MLVGLVAANVPVEQRKRIILLGVVVATALRVVFALVVSYLLSITGLLLVGGLLLLWATWKMWRQLGNGAKHRAPVRKPTSVREAVLLIVLADVAMSLDNVLGVAGAAYEHTWVLVTGLAFSVLLMAVSSTYVSRLLDKYRWLIYIGLLVILQVALGMVWEGGQRRLVSRQLRLACAGLAVACTGFSGRSSTILKKQVVCPT